MCFSVRDVAGQFPARKNGRTECSRTVGNVEHLILVSNDHDKVLFDALSSMDAMLYASDDRMIDT